jgi:polysaccharide export outer membrane protein
MRLAFQILAALACAIAAQSQQHDTNVESATDSHVHITAGYAMDDKHVLTPGDRLSFQILQDKDAAKSLTVTDSSELDVPYIGRVSIEHETCKGAAAQVKALLEEKYYYHATIVIGLDSINKLRGKVYVQGQVRSQGSVDLLLDQKLTAGKAILMSGGFADFANKRKVKVVRASDVPGAASKTFELNMVDILENGLTGGDIFLEPNDYIIVPSRAVNF